MSTVQLHPFLQQHLVDPVTHQKLMVNSGELRSSDGGVLYEVVDGIPVLLSALNPVDESETRHREHYTVDAELFDYFEERPAVTEHDERRLQEVILRAFPTSCSSILDVGCGRAWVASRFQHSATTVCSMDISLNNPREALRRFGSENHCALVADAMHLPFADGTLPCIVASEIIEHLPDPAAFVKELLRVLAPGGRLVISTPYKEVLQYVLCIHCNQKTPLHAHIQSFDEHRLRSLVPDAARLCRWEIFGNKALHRLRCYVFLQYLPHPLWRFVDRFANLLFHRPEHIVVVWKK